MGREVCEDKYRSVCVWVKEEEGFLRMDLGGKINIKTRVG